MHTKMIIRKQQQLWEGKKQIYSNCVLNENQLILRKTKIRNDLMFLLIDQFDLHQYWNNIIP